jgi:tetratricopeptide (TPR) repeat protein/DNA-binding CsgD family transcriptional regulator
MPDLEKQLEEATNPYERMKLIAESSERFSFTDFDRAVELVHEALPLARKRMKQPSPTMREGQRAYALLLRASGFQCYSRSKFEQARRNFEEALPLFEHLNDRWDVAHTVQLLGGVAASLCDYDKALDLFKRSKQLLEEAEDHAGALRSLNNIAGIYKRTGHHDEAFEHFSLARRLAVSIGDTDSEANALIGMGMVQTDQGNFENALQSLLSCLALREAAGNRNGIANVLLHIGNVFASIPKYREAIGYFEQSLALDDTPGGMKSRGVCCVNLGTMYLGLGELAEARTWLEQGLVISKGVENLHCYSLGLAALAEVLLGQNEIDNALECIHEALDLMERINERDGMADAFLTLGHLQSQKGNLPTATGSIDHAIEIATTMGAKPVIRKSYELLSKIYRDAGEPAKALEYFERYHAINEELLRTEVDRRVQTIALKLEREQAEQREALLRVENERIERELDLKTKHLATMAMSIVQHSNFLNTIGKGIGEAAKKAPKTRKQPLDQLFRQVKQQAHSKDEWRVFEEQLNNLSPDVIANLAKRFPELTPTELKICALMKLGLGSKEMAALLSVSLRSIETYRLRIRRKLKLEGEENLMVFLLKT